MEDETISTSLRITPKLRRRFSGDSHKRYISVEIKAKNKHDSWDEKRRDALTRSLTFKEPSVKSALLVKSYQPEQHLGKSQSFGEADQKRGNCSDHSMINIINSSNTNVFINKTYIVDNKMESSTQNTKHFIKSSVVLSPIKDFQGFNKVNDTFQNKHLLDLNHNNVENVEFNNNQNYASHFFVTQNNANIKDQLKPTVKSTLEIQVGSSLNIEKIVETDATKESQISAISKPLTETPVQRLANLDESMGVSLHETGQIDATNRLAECLKELETNANSLKTKKKSRTRNKSTGDVPDPNLLYDSNEDSENDFFSTENIYENGNLYRAFNDRMTHRGSLSNRDIRNLARGESEDNRVFKMEKKSLFADRLGYISDENESRERLDKVANLDNRFRPKRATPRKPKRSFDRQPLVQGNHFYGNLSSSLDAINHLKRYSLFRGLNVQLDNKNNVFISKEDFDAFVKLNRNKFSSRVDKENEFLSRLDSSIETEASTIGSSNLLGSQSYLMEKSKILGDSSTDKESNNRDRSFTESPNVMEIKRSKESFKNKMGHNIDHVDAAIKSDLSFLMEDFHINQDIEEEYFETLSNSVQDVDSNISETYSDVESLATFTSSNTSTNKINDREFYTYAKPCHKTSKRAKELGTVLDSQIEQMESFLSNNDNSLKNSKISLNVASGNEANLDFCPHSNSTVKLTIENQSASHDLASTQRSSSPYNEVNIDDCIRNSKKNYVKSKDFVYVDDDDDYGFEKEYRPPTYRGRYPDTLVKKLSDPSSPETSFGIGKIRKSFKSAKEKFSRLHRRLGFSKRKGKQFMSTPENETDRISKKGSISTIRYRYYLQNSNPPERFRNDFRTSRMMGIEYDCLKKELDKERKEVSCNRIYLHHLMCRNYRSFTVYDNLFLS